MSPPTRSSACGPSTKPSATYSTPEGRPGAAHGAPAHEEAAQVRQHQQPHEEQDGVHCSAAPVTSRTARRRPSAMPWSAMACATASARLAAPLPCLGTAETRQRAPSASSETRSTRARSQVATRRAHERLFDLGGALVRDRRRSRWWPARAPRGRAWGARGRAAAGPAPRSRRRPRAPARAASRRARRPRGRRPRRSRPSFRRRPEHGGHAGRGAGEHRRARQAEGHERHDARRARARRRRCP